MGEEVICAVPGCNNTLTEEQREKKIAVCSSCEAAKMHLCGACSRKIRSERIRSGATLCEECEMNPGSLEEPDMEMMGVEEGFGTNEEEDLMI